MPLANFLMSAAVAALLVCLTVLIHYEALRGISRWLPHLQVRPRQRILVVILGVFAAHTVEVWVFAIAYWLMIAHWELGVLSGGSQNSIFEFAYFSVVVYTSLGFGDIQPVAHVRMIAGVEALVGLLMIGWSASFTYLMMERFWPEHEDDA
jgi:hypothetical protein